MTEQDKPTADEKVPCKLCLKEIPVSAAKVDEAVGYVSYFCGLDCYEKWKEQNQKEPEE